MSRRTCRTRAVFSSWPVARWKRRLNCSFLSFKSSSSSWSTVMARTSSGFIMALLRNALNEARLDRQLGGSKRQSLARDLLAHAIDLEQDAAWLDARDPKLGRALAGSHANLERLLRHRHIRIHSDPDAAGTLHMTCQCTSRRLDLAGGDTVRLHRFETILAKIQVGRARRNALDPAFMRLAKFGARRL